MREGNDDLYQRVGFIKRGMSPFLDGSLKESFGLGNALSDEWVDCESVA